MGVDICGLRSKELRGSYFSYNWSGWTPLACFIAEHVDISESKKWLFCNDGERISRESCMKIASFLRKALENKEQYKEWIDEFEKKYEEGWPEQGDKFSWEIAEEFADFCEDSNGFVIR